MILAVSRRSTSGAHQAMVDEADLIRRCRAGERAGQDELYERYRSQVAATLYRVLNDRTDLDDLVQEVFVIAFRGLDRFRGESRLSTWLYRICVNVALGRIRAKTRRPPHLLTDPIVEPATTPAEQPEALLQRKRDRERIHRLLEALPAKKRIVLYLHEIEGLDLKEIAYIVGAHPVTVRTRLFYARKELYKLAIEEGGE